MTLVNKGGGGAVGGYCVTSTDHVFIGCDAGSLKVSQESVLSVRRSKSNSMTLVR